jgi:hypothetical protein
MTAFMKNVKKSKLQSENCEKSKLLSEKCQFYFFLLFTIYVRGEFKFKRDYVNKMKMITFWEKKWKHVL